SKSEFELERSIVAETERCRQENDDLVQLRAQKLKALHEERIRKQKEEARKIAPGFLDTDQKILTPTRASQQLENSSNTVINNGAEIDNQKRLHSRSTSDERVKARSLVHLFEESLPPRNPWNSSNSVQNDMSILKEMIVLSNGTQNYISNGHITSPPVMGPYVVPEVSPLAPTNPTRSFHPSPLLQPVAMPLHQSPSHSFTLGPPLSTHGNPEPPKEVISSSSSTTTTITNHSLTNEEKGEKDEAHDLIKEFTNMGFTKSQAVEALEKYNNDPHKATNYLLDMQQNY
ncbi:7747_t:CDS:2, partial [Acaulospora colombiana]